MNFSNTYSLKKLLSLIVALFLLVGMFAGCQKDDSTDDTTEPQISLDMSGNAGTSETETEPTQTQPMEINENMATVTNQLTVRNTPSKEASVAGVLDAGIVVEIMRRESVADIEWGYITDPVVGWICLDYVEMLVPQEGDSSSEDTPAATNPDAAEPGSNASTEGFKGIITASELRIRSEASANGDVVGSYVKGDVVTILETKNNWGRTNKGWISMDYVSTSGTGSSNNNTDNNNNDNSGSDGNGSTTVVAKGVVTTSELNIRSKASTDSDKVGSLSYGDRVEILEKSGDWGRIEKGWISLNYVYQDGTTGSKTAKGIVTGNGLNIRTGPGTGYGTNGSYSAGDRVNVLEQIKIGDTTWGCTSKGWISMAYVYVDGTDVGESGNGTVTADELRIRSGPGTSYDVVGTYNSGDEVVILYQLTVGDTTWGCTNKGWISMAYVE